MPVARLAAPTIGQPPALLSARHGGLAGGRPRAHHRVLHALVRHPGRPPVRGLPRPVPRQRDRPASLPPRRRRRSRSSFCARSSTSSRGQGLAAALAILSAPVVRRTWLEARPDGKRSHPADRAAGGRDAPAGRASPQIGLWQLGRRIGRHPSGSPLNRPLARRRAHRDPPEPDLCDLCDLCAGGVYVSVRSRRETAP